MQSVKAKSSKWVNEASHLGNRFEWQKGFGAFTYSQGQTDKIYRYILNQETHHKKITFLEEYERMLKIYKVDYEQRFLFVAPI